MEVSGSGVDELRVRGKVVGQSRTTSGFVVNASGRIVDDIVVNLSIGLADDLDTVRIADIVDRIIVNLVVIRARGGVIDCNSAISINTSVTNRSDEHIGNDIVVN